MATVTEPQHTCQQFSIELKIGKMEFLTFAIRFFEKFRAPSAHRMSEVESYSTALGAVYPGLARISYLIGLPFSSLIRSG